MYRYRSLDAGRIVATIETLLVRIDRRFPDSGLGRVCRELLSVAQGAAALSRSLARPIYPLRILTWGLIVGLLGLVIVPFVVFDFSTGLDSISEFVQTVEAGINDVVLLGLGVFFLTTVEGRLKRRRALRALRELRSISHVVDMHQLTKDPELVLSESGHTDRGEQPRMSRQQVAKYLDYCSEMLSLTSKIAALYVQGFDDAVVLEAVNEIEALTTSLSRKIWQKIMILDAVAATQPST